MKYLLLTLLLLSSCIVNDDTPKFEGRYCNDNECIELHKFEVGSVFGNGQYSGICYTDKYNPLNCNYDKNYNALILIWPDWTAIAYEKQK